MGGRACIRSGFCLVGLVIIAISIILICLEKCFCFIKYFFSLQQFSGRTPEQIGPRNYHAGRLYLWVGVGVGKTALTFVGASWIPSYLRNAISKSCYYMYKHRKYGAL